MTTSFLYTVPQWFVFAALFMIVYGWVEQKKAFRLIGSSLIILLGILSLIIVFGDYLSVGDYLSPAEVAAEELDNEVLNEIPVEVQLFPGYLSFIVSSVLAIPALLLDWTDKKRAKLFIVLTALAALAGFFIIVGTIRGM